MTLQQSNWTAARIMEAVDDYSALVDAEMTMLITRETAVPNLHDGMLYALGLDVEDRKVRGKRLRPALCIMTAVALDSDPKRALRFACAIELLHNFALVHDDIEDGDSMRRGRAAVWKKHGLAHGINIGDYLFAKSYHAVIRDKQNPPEVRQRLLEVLDATTEKLFAGQAMDMNARQSRSFSMAEYEELVACKTGSYLAAPMLGGAIVGGADDATLERLREVGHALGPLFQIKDDLIDLTSGKGRGETGNDIREGKRSFLVAASLEEASPEESECLYSILDKPREETTPEDIHWAIDFFRRTDAVTRAEERCAELLRQAHAAIEALPQELRAMLGCFAEVLAERKA